MTFVQYVHDLFEEYYEGKKEGKDISQLRAEIEEIVLTGEQIMESGITDFSEIRGEYEDEIEKLEDKLERYQEAYKKGLRKLAQNDNTKTVNLLKVKIAKIERIIHGKYGTIADEIKDAIR